MRKKYTHFETVPVAVIEKILKVQISVADQNGNRKPAVKKSKRAASRSRSLPKKDEVLTS
jgi:hypothetical protein